VTTTTIVRKIAAVRIVIVFVVAADATGFRISENLVKVAGFTLDVCMFAEQRESSQVVREIRCFLPAHVIVTILTLLSLLALVYVIVQMACSAS
jgi:hypothetical protein